jgi:hypothetical protein
MKSQAAEPRLTGGKEAAMRSGRTVGAVVLALLGAASAARAQVGNTPNTLKLEKSERSPFMGGRGEEVFAPPEGETFGRGRSLRNRRPRCFETGARYRFLGSQSPNCSGLVAARGVSALGGASRRGSGSE